MVVREYDYIKGSTAVKPERKIREKKHNNKKRGLHKLKRNKQLLEQQKQRKNNRKYAATIAAMIFTFGCITILGDSRVYKMQKNVTDLNSDIKKMQEENEALKVKLLKFSSLSNIEESAVANLGMVTPNQGDTIKIDFSEDYFASLKTHDEPVKKQSIISKLMSLVK